jgi:hypothetical protein
MAVFQGADNVGTFQSEPALSFPITPQQTGGAQMIEKAGQYAKGKTVAGPLQEQYDFVAILRLDLFRDTLPGRS